MKKEVIAITILMLLYGGIFTLNSPSALGKDSTNESNNDQTTTTNKQTSEDSDIIPITVNEPTPVSKTTVVLPTCTDESTDPNCAAKKTISNTPDPTIQKVTPIAKTEDNSLNTISAQDNDINDTTLLLQLNNSAQ